MRFEVLRGYNWMLEVSVILLQAMLEAPCSQAMEMMINRKVSN